MTVTYPKNPIIIEPKVIWHIYCAKEYWNYKYQLNNNNYKLTASEENRCVRDSTGKDILKYLNKYNKMDNKRW